MSDPADAPPADAPVGGLRLAQRLGRDQLAISLALYQARTPDIVVMAAACGFDAVSVDLEHSAISIETASMLCTVALQVGVTPLVRVTSVDILDRVLGIGAAGAIVPHVASVSDASRAVDACHFPPAGHRSVGGTGALTGFAPLGPAATLSAMQASTFVAAMVESVAAVEDVRAIAAVEGLDMLVVGPHDLTTELGVPGRFDDPRFLDALSAVADACAGTGTVFGIAGIADPDLLGDLTRKGLRYVSAGTDGGFFAQAAAARVNQLRALRP